MKTLISGLILVGCGASTSSGAHPTWEEAERRREECGGATVAIQVDAIEIQAQGSRSQRMILEARVLNSSDPLLGDQLHTDQYVGGDAFMHQGERYVVALCPVEGTNQVVGWKPLVVGATPERDADEEGVETEDPS